MSVVVLTVVHDEMEADVLCGMLRVNGIACSYRRSDISSAVWGGTPAIGGPTEVLVNELDFARARDLLPQS